MAKRKGKIPPRNAKRRASRPAAYNHSRQVSNTITNNFGPIFQDPHDFQGNGDGSNTYNIGGVSTPAQKINLYTSILPLLKRTDQKPNPLLTKLTEFETAQDHVHSETQDTNPTQVPERIRQRPNTSLAPSSRISKANQSNQPTRNVHKVAQLVQETVLHDIVPGDIILELEIEKTTDGDALVEKGKYMATPYDYLSCKEPGLLVQIVDRANYRYTGFRVTTYGLD
ncbi:hypothetical protein P280DRAFT_520126 [Massarina eburnea CBS 473.64]|uniref:Uncharacterized protein n=1 Tax=Massarina eburnea CBS 473.64 TaxID=1395130 RepID=A0A6A6RWW5_9PLEO|nr:hypothetical protein P280DRAFT_520126 [Massarina eburnea CBS 473.64]